MSLISQTLKSQTRSDLNSAALTPENKPTDESWNHDRPLSYRDYIRQHWASYAFGVFCLFFTTLTEVLSPKFAGWAIDLVTHELDRGSVIARFLGPNHQRNILTLAGLFSLNMLLATFFRAGWRQTLARRTHHSNFIFRLRYWSALRYFADAKLRNYSLGDLITRGISDINQVRFIFGFTWALTFDLVFFVIAGTIAMLFIDPFLTLLSLAVFPLTWWPIRVLARRQMHYHQASQQVLGELSEFISQTVSTARLQRATASEAPWIAGLNRLARTYAARSYRSIVTFNHIMPFGTLPTIGAYCVLIFLGLPRVASGNLTAGDLVAMFSFVLLMQSPLFELGPCLAEWQRGLVGLRRMNEIILNKTPREFLSRTNAEMDLPRRGALPIAIKGLTLAYGTSEKPVLKGLDLTLAQGEKIGLRGEVGSGKTTLIKAIAGLAHVSQGEIRLFGQRVQDIPRPLLTKKLVVVPQQSFLFSGTVRTNLLLDESFPDERLWKVLECVALTEDGFIREKGLETLVGEWGVNLSGGQRQRLALARALLREAEIFLFDDCLSAVDTVTESLILERLSVFLAGKTMIWTAHRASTLKLCDRILDLNAFRGVRSQLLTKEHADAP